MSLVIGNDSLSLSSLPRLPTQGAVLDGGSISNASNSSLSEVFVEVPGRGTVRTTAHGPGTDSFFKDDSYKDSVEAMWGERPPVRMHKGLGRCGHMANSPPIKASRGGGAGGTTGPGGQAPGAAESHRPRLGQVPSAMREENQEVLGGCGSAAGSSSMEVGCSFGGGDTDSLGGGASAIKTSCLPLLGQEPSAVRATNNDELVGRGSAASFFVGGTGRGFGEGDTDGQGGPAMTTKTSYPPILEQEPPALGQTFMGTRGDMEALHFFAGGTGRGSSGGDTDGQGGGAMATKRSRFPVLDQEPLAPKTKNHKEPGRRKSAADFVVGGTGHGFSDGDMGGMQGGATATAKSHLPVPGQELTAVKENNHGKLVGCRNTADFVPTTTRRGDGNASTAPIRHSHWGPVPLVELAQRKADQGGHGSCTHLPSGRWPGTGDPSAISRFVALHFRGNWQAYISFAVWADSRALEDPDGAVYIE
jgi:hypothetical protein